MENKFKPGDKVRFKTEIGFFDPAGTVFKEGEIVELQPIFGDGQTCYLNGSVCVKINKLSRSEWCVSPEYLELVGALPQPQPCSCSLLDLMSRGCDCGGV